MSLTDEQIKNIMQKDVEAKTILADKEEVESLINTYQKDGWKLVKQSPLNDRIKVTFQRTK